MEEISQGQSQKAPMLGSANQGMGKAGMHLPAVPVFAPAGVVQRAAITPVAAALALTQRAPLFDIPTTTIITPDDGAGSNCHGYTITGAVGNIVNGEDLLGGIAAVGNVAVFYNNSDVAHSGRMAGTTLNHLLIGVGIVQTTNADAGLFGYTHRFNLPADQPALDVHLGNIAALATAKTESQELFRITEQIHIDHGVELAADAVFTALRAEVDAHSLDMANADVMSAAQTATHADLLARVAAFVATDARFGAIAAGPAAAADDAADDAGDGGGGDNAAAAAL